MESNIPPAPAVPVFHSEPVASRLSYDGPKGPLFKALAEARKHFGPLGASATADVTMKAGGKYSFSYAPLDVVLDALAPGLQAAGLALLQPFDGDVLYTIVAFEGSSLTIETPLPNWATPQELGSLLTYLRRYQIKGLFGVADSEDDDGNAASGNKATVERKAPKTAEATGPKIPEELRKEVSAAAKAIELGYQDFLRRAQKSAGKPWVEYTENDATKLLAELVLKP
jgi:hypothetical protein